MSTRYIPPNSKLYLPAQVHHPSPQGGFRVVPGHDLRDGGRLGGDGLADHPVDAAADRPGQHQGLQAVPVRLQGWLIEALIIFVSSHK